LSRLSNSTQQSVSIKMCFLSRQLKWQIKLKEKMCIPPSIRDNALHKICNNFSWCHLLGNIIVYSEPIQTISRNRDTRKNTVQFNVWHSSTFFLWLLLFEHQFWLQNLSILFIQFRPASVEINMEALQKT
jgi:hypothetical protein